MPLLKWFANDHNRFGCTLEFAANNRKRGDSFAEDSVELGVQCSRQKARRTCAEAKELILDSLGLFSVAISTCFSIPYMFLWSQRPAFNSRIPSSCHSSHP